MNKVRGELYRNPSQGKIAGVCAGIADYFGWETWLVRILVVSAVLFGMPFLILGYIAAWFILDKAPGMENSQKHKAKRRKGQCSQYDTNKYDELSRASIKVKARVWQSGEPPKQAFHDIKRKFTSLERQLRNMEHYVTSPEFTVSREINKL
ncbi:MAG: envelope stress response membrane protein PspC [Colwellia sp.]